MFKAIGRWGSSVRSTINVRIFANIFGSKSKKYGDLGHEDEEIFIDALETIDPETDTEDDQNSVNVKTEIHSTDLDKPDGNLAHGSESTTNTSNDPLTTEAEIVEVKEKGEEDITTVLNVQDIQQSSSHDEPERHSNSGSERIDTADDKSESEHETNDEDDDDQHVNHKDTKKMVINSKPDNGIVHSASSSSLMKKVHRRMNSYSQRQYSKFDNTQEDDNDNIVLSEETQKDNQDIQEVVDDSIEQSQVLKTEKKTKRKKKIAKQTRKAMRGSWKWFKRSMVAYASTFNFSSLFVVNIASAARK